MNTRFVHVYPSTMNPCSPAFGSNRTPPNWLCTGCCRPRPDVHGIDIQIQEATPGRGALNFVSGTGVAVARKAALKAMGDLIVSRDLYVGRVFGPGGEVIKDWATYRGRYRIAVRGTEHISHRICESCGCSAYFAMGERHLFPSPPPDAQLFESGPGGLVLETNLADRIGIKSWRAVHIEQLPIVPAPLDGLSEVRP